MSALGQKRTSSVPEQTCESIEPAELITRSRIISSRCRPWHARWHYRHHSVLMVVADGRGRRSSACGCAHSVPQHSRDGVGSIVLSGMRCHRRPQSGLLGRGTCGADTSLIPGRDHLFQNVAGGDSALPRLDAHSMKLLGRKSDTNLRKT